MKLFIFILANLIAVSAVAKESVVLGRVIGSKELDGPEVPCSDGMLCVGWWRWTLEIRKTITGPTIRGKVLAANTQHVGMRLSYQKRQKLFVLKSIDDPKQRKELGADFILKDMSSADKMFCLWSDPNELGLETDVYASVESNRKRYCFELPPEE